SAFHCARSDRLFGSTADWRQKAVAVRIADYAVRTLGAIELVLAEPAGSVGQLAGADASPGPCGERLGLAERGGRQLPLADLVQAPGSGPQRPRRPGVIALRGGRD